MKCINNEIKEQIKRCLEKNESKNTTTQNLWEREKEVLREKFTAIQADLNKQEKNLKQSNLISKGTRKRSIALAGVA